MSKMNADNVSRVIEVLNKARSMELHSVHQYMNQHYNLDNLDYGKLAASVKRIAIDEMTHAENFAERIKELEGEPGSELAAKVVKGQALTDIYPFNTALESDVLETYNTFAGVCRDNHDNVSARLFEDTLGDEQKHFDYFTNTNAHLTQLGATFLAGIAGTPNDIGDSAMGFVKNM